MRHFVQPLLYLTADSADCRRFFSSTEIIMNWTWIIQKFLYQKQLIQQIPLGFAAFVMKWRKNCPQIPQICTDSLRMIRTKSDGGGRFRVRNLTFDWGLHWQTRLSWQPPSDVDRWWASPSPPLFNFIRLIRMFVKRMLYVFFLRQATKAAKPSGSCCL